MQGHSHTTFSYRINLDHFFFVHYAAILYVQWIFLSGHMKMRSTAKSGHSLVAVLLEYFNLIISSQVIFALFL